MLSSYLVSQDHRLKRQSRREGSTGKRVSRPGAAALILLLALCCFAPATASSQDKIDDSDIARAIEVRLTIDKSVPAHLLDVSANEGVVTLAGSVDSLHARKQAVQITETVRGVTAIVDLIQIKPPVRSDDAIKKDVEEALVEDPAADSYELATSVSDGVARLAGTVDSWTEKMLAEEVAGRVKGVKGVKADQVVVDIKTRRPDPEITQDVKQTLAMDEYVDDGLINVETRDGTVYLSGSVGSLAERTRAANIALVAGAGKINADDLAVKYWLRNNLQRTTPYPTMSDAEIKEAVENALLYDPRVFSFEIDVNVSGGLVMLSGVVDNLGAKNAAEKDAENTIGVWNVTNLIKVRPDISVAAIPDAEIAADILKALDRDYLLSSDDIAVKVSNKKAFLYGNVSSRYEKEHAGDVASLVPGVVNVENNLVVTSVWEWESDLAIEQNIRDEFFWSVFVDGDDINVSVNDGIAALDGSVDSWSEFKAAVNNSFEGGAKSVRTHLAVQGLEPLSQTYYFPFDHYYTPF